MKRSINWKEIRPYLFALVAFYLITAAYFSPMLEGKRLVQMDIMKHRGAAKEIQDHREKYQEDPYWTNSMFGGMPAYLISARYTSDFMRNVGKVFMGFMPIPAGAVFLYMVGFFILMRVLGVDPWLSIMGAVAFAFSSYFFIILEAGHNTKALAVGYMAPIFAGVILLYRGRYLLGAGVMALFLALGVKANHPQITYYMFLMIGVYLIFMLISAFREKQLKQYFTATAIFVVVTFLAAGTHFTHLATINEWGQVSIRGQSELSIDQGNKTTGLDRDYATQWSYGIGETWSLLVPNFKGGASGAIGNDRGVLEQVDPRMHEQVAGSNQYWGDQPFTSGPVYVGAIVFFLAILAMFVLKGPLKWALFVATIFSILLSWGRNFPELTFFFLDYFPAYNKFRAVSMILVVAELCIPLLAILGLKEVIEKPALMKRKIDLKAFKVNTLILSFALSGGIALLFWLSPGTFNSFESKGEEDMVRQQVAQQLRGTDATPEQISQTVNNYTFEYMNELRKARQVIFKRDAIRSFLFVLLAAALLFLYMRGWLKRNLLIAGIFLFVLIDMWVINLRYLNKDHFRPKRVMEVPYQPTQADLTILNDPDINFRVFKRTVSTFNDASTSYFHKSIGGYHGAKLRRYQEMIDFHLAANHFRLLDMLNMKWTIMDPGDGVPRAVPNPDAMGNAWFVDEIKWVDNPDQEYIYIGDAAVVRAAPGALVSVYGEPFSVDTVSANKPLRLSTPARPDSTFDIKLADYRLMDGVTYRFGLNDNDTTEWFVNIRDPRAGGKVLPLHFEAEMVYRFNPEKTAVINRKWSEEINVQTITPDTNAMIRLLSYKPNHLVYKTRAATDQVAVFSEIFYEAGWNAYLNGEPVSHGRANWILRTMVVPAGEHTIEFRFEPSIIRVAEPISIASSVLVLLLFVTSLYLHFSPRSLKKGKDS